MGKRAFDFLPAKRESIKAYFGFVCAACGAQDRRSLSADHWIAGDAFDEGICLCIYCNVTIKRNIVIHEKFRLVPRNPVTLDSEYLNKIHTNQDAFALWIRRYNMVASLKGANISRIKFFVAPY